MTLQTGKPRTALRAALLRALPGACCLLLAAGAPVQARQIYKSVDAQGRVVYSNQADPAQTQTPLALAPDAGAVPEQIHFCWTNCFTLQWAGGQYQRSDGTAETWTVEHFGSDSVILHRHDAPAAWNGNSADVTYAGQVADGQLTNITVNGHPVPEVAMAWGAALGKVPGSNAERDQRLWVPSAAPVPAPELRSASAMAGAADDPMSSSLAPPPLQEDEQPEGEVDGELWTPGYWAWRGARYFWIPGIWVRPPRPGLLWTPGYWIYADGSYVFQAGYWGAHVGYYGGINYGCGYFGDGYSGGRWIGSTFTYNQSVNRLNTRALHNTYYETVVKPPGGPRVSYAGGPGGTSARPSARDQAAAAEPHSAPTAQQAPAAALAASAARIRAQTNSTPASNKAATASRLPQPAATPRGEQAPAPGARARSPGPAEAGEQASGRQAAPGKVGKLPRL